MLRPRCWRIPTTVVTSRVALGLREAVRCPDIAMDFMRAQAIAQEMSREVQPIGILSATRTAFTLAVCHERKWPAPDLQRTGPGGGRRGVLGASPRQCAVGAVIWTRPEVFGAAPEPVAAPLARVISVAVQRRRSIASCAEHRNPGLVAFLPAVRLGRRRLWELLG